MTALETRRSSRDQRGPSGPKRHSTGRVAIIVAILSLLAAGAAVAGVVYLVMNPAKTTQAPGARPEYPEPAPGVDPVAKASFETQHPAPDGQTGEPYVPPPPLPGQPLRLQIPSVGIDASVGAMSIPANRSVDPPTARSAYWMRDYSVLGANATGTGYIAGHTYRGTGKAVFNALFDQKTRDARIHAGDEVKVTTPEGVSTYTVTSVHNLDKKEVVNQNDIWQDVPGRLVLVACWYNGADLATANMVIFANRVAS